VKNGKKIMAVLGVICALCYSAFAEYKAPTVITISNTSTSTQLASTGRAKWIVIEAGANNTGSIYYGGSSVNATNGMILDAKDSRTIRGEGGYVNLANVYVTGNTVNDTVKYDWEE
jgi:hypothetical protein